MKNSDVTCMNGRNTNISFFMLLFFVMALFVCVGTSYAQPALPQRSLTVTATQALHFGTFCLTGGAGGTVILGFDGSRTSTGSVTLLSMTPAAHPAIFEIKLCQGRNVIITFSASTTLSGSDGGVLSLEVGPTERGGNSAMFATNNDCNFITPLRVGGTLHIPGTATPGTYSGNFFITFNQE
ncbi:MAG: DUF4402 domain-containing protein [Bacteroidetes bacterium]|nr:DUF4402 domain-containing protein [Bacteroidota bacterium]